MTAHCSTCTCTQGSTPEFCGSTATRAHETFTCNKRYGHDGHHLDPSGGWPICPACDGVDMHSDDCPRGDVTTPGFADITWDDDGNVTVEEWTP